MTTSTPDQSNPADLPEKLVIVVAEGLDPATAANTCALLALSVGARHPALIGPTVTDADQQEHAGISTVPVPVLRAPADRVAALARPDRPGVSAVGFARFAASCQTYDAYIAAMAATPAGDVGYFGVALAGPKRQVNSLTGSLPLLP